MASRLEFEARECARLKSCFRSRVWIEPDMYYRRLRKMSNIYENDERRYEHDGNNDK